MTRDGHQCVSCREPVASRDADIHHLLPRSMGGTDDPANLITLCDGCHAAHHPNLSGGLAKRAMERWAVWLARLFDLQHDIDDSSRFFGPGLRLLGVQRFREGQLPVVEAALAGKSVLVVRPTGSGKTLCFQLPALLRPGLTVVISPLKALMSEQVSTLLRKKVPATFVNSDLGLDEKKLRYTLLRRGAIKLLHVAPERFFVRSEAERARLSELRPAYLVVDEAHCVDQWGRDFRPEYGRIKDIRSMLGNPPVLAFTATAGRDMQARIMSSLGVDDAEVFVSGVDRPNIALYRWQATRGQRAALIEKLLAVPLPVGSKTMIFVPTAKVGEQLKTELAKRGVEVPLYHSKMGTPFQREQIVKRFTGQSEPSIDRLITTSAFGMGIDVPAVRLVIHWQHPASVEDLLQELGRAGRDGRQSAAVVFHEQGEASDDVKLLQFMAKLSAGDATTADESKTDPREFELMVQGDEATWKRANELAALESRFSQIEKVAQLMGEAACYRRRIISYFEGPEPRQRSLGIRILEFFFSVRASRVRSSYCCDLCDKGWKPSQKNLKRKVGRPQHVVQEHAKLVHLANVLAGPQTAEAFAKSLEASQTSNP